MRKGSEGIGLEEKGVTAPLKADSEDDYDPHLHRDVPKATNNFETLVHLLKCSLGTGILAMPQAFGRAGLITSIISTVLVGILCTYGLHLLVRAQYSLCKRRRVPLLTYPNSMEVALQEGPAWLRPMSKASNTIVDIFIIVYQLGIGCVYIVFIANNMKAIFDPYHVMSVEIHMLIILAPLIALNCIKTLKFLAPFSTFANIITFVGLGIIVYYLTTGEKEEGDLDYWGTAVQFPLFFGTMLFALTAVGVVIALENNMKTPKAFGAPFGVLNTGMVVIVILYIGIGSIGYNFCRSKCEDTITLNLPHNDPLATSVQALMAIAIFISYGLHCYVPVSIVWQTYVYPKVKDSTKIIYWEYLVRVGLCILTFVLAVAIPQLGLFISLFGALCLSALGLMFPAIMNACVNFPDRFGPLKAYLVKDSFIFLIGIVGMVAGTYSALAAIVRTFTN